MPLTPHFVDHSDACPPIDPFDTTPLKCSTCSARRRSPYWEDGPEKVECPRCGADDVPTSADPLFKGYLGYHNKPWDWRSMCSASYHHFGGETTERVGRPGWVPLAHIVPGDIIRVREEWPRPRMVDHQVLYNRPYVVDERFAVVTHPLHRTIVGYLIESGTGGVGGGLGEAVLLVKPADGPPPQAHTRLHFRNAISRVGRESRCYRTQADADHAKIHHRPWNNTDFREDECWKPTCFA